jgi:hypothetical protein
VISSLSINSGRLSPQKIYLEVDADKASQIILPSGRILNSTAGVIDYNYTGRGGNVSLIVPKDTSKILVNDSDVGGDVFVSNNSGTISVTDANHPSVGTQFRHASFPNASTVTFVSRGLKSISAPLASTLYCYSQPIEDLHAPYAIILDARFCALNIENVKSILDNAYTLWLADSAIVVNINLSGGTNASIDLADSSAVHSGTYEDIRNTLTFNGTVTLNIV